LRIFYADYAIGGTNLSVLEKVYLIISDEGYVIRLTRHKPKNSVEEQFEDAVIVPGFVNLHTHIGDSFAKEVAYGLEVKRAVGTSDSVKKRLLESVDFETFKLGVKNAVNEMLSSGTTTFVDFREGGVDGVKMLKNVLEELRIRSIVLGRGTNGNWAEVLMISDGFGIGNINKLDDNKLKTICRMAYSQRKYFAFHASETMNLRIDSTRKFGMSDLTRGLLITKPSFIVHATYANISEIKLLARERIPIVICPRANAYFGSGVPPLKEFFQNGLIMGIGTDNVMANSPDIFREFDFLVRQLRLESVTVDPKEILSLATKNAVKILNLPLGSLEEGFHADFFVFDLNKPNVAGMDDIIKAIVLRGKSENVTATFIDGKKVFQR